MELVQIGLSEVERSMRDYYEELYISNPDSEHSFFKNSVLRKSPFSNCENDYALLGHNYWTKVLYLVLKGKYKPNEAYFHEQIEKLNLLTYTLKKKNNIFHNFSASNNNLCFNNDSINIFFEDHIRYMRQQFHKIKKKIDKLDLSIGLDDNRLFSFYIYNALTLFFKLLHIPLHLMFIYSKDIDLQITYNNKYFNVILKILKNNNEDPFLDLNFYTQGISKNSYYSSMNKKIKYLDLAVDETQINNNLISIMDDG